MPLISDKLHLLRVFSPRRPLYDSEKTISASIGSIKKTDKAAAAQVTAAFCIKFRKKVRTRNTRFIFILYLCSRLHKNYNNNTLYGKDF